MSDHATQSSPPPAAHELPQGMPPIVIAERDTWEQAILNMGPWTLTITNNAGREFDMKVNHTGSDEHGFVTLIGHIINEHGHRAGEVTIGTEDIASVYVN